MKRMIKMRVVIISIVIVIYLWSLTVRIASMVMISPEEDIQRDAIDLPQNDAERYISMNGKS
jgi:flagellar basal body-associated protein FliL